MVLDVQGGYALIPGASRDGKDPRMRIKVIRKFWYQDKLFVEGSEETPAYAEVPEHLARELVASAKATYAPPAPEAVHPDSKE